MALTKKVIKDNGLTTTYHRILLVSIDCASTNTITSVMIASYVDESYRLKEKNGECENTVAFIESYDIDLSVSSDSLAFSALYGKIKELEEFRDSEDN